MTTYWAIIMMLCSLVATCGHKGPLQLPAGAALHRADAIAVVAADNVSEVHLEP